MENLKYTCPICGYIVFSQKPGSYSLCPVCGWEDDISQLKFISTTGANKSSIIEAQTSFVYKNTNSQYKKDPNWRPVDLEKDKIESMYLSKDYGNDYPEDSTDLYYWKIKK